MRLSLFGVGSHINQHVPRDSFGMVRQLTKAEDDGFILPELKAREQEVPGALQAVFDAGRLVCLEQRSTIHIRLW